MLLCIIRGRLNCHTICGSHLLKFQVAARREISWFPRKKTTSEDESVEVESAEARKRRSFVDDRNMAHNLKMLKSQSLLTTKKGYYPTSDVNNRAQRIVEQAYGATEENWIDVSLKDARTKYQILTKLIDEFDHDIPNYKLTDMKTVADAVSFFETEVRETSAFEDLDKIELPKNLSIMKEYHRFDPETDKFFGGRTAFPGSDTFVSSIKFKRKYKSIKIRKEKPGFVNHYAGY